MKKCYENDDRLILTLDAGGTNFSFSAFKNGHKVVENINHHAEVHNLNKCLELLVRGFREVASLAGEKPHAISFAFPGPADYPHGIIDNMGNLPAFAGGVPLGPYLSEVFGIPVYINNDGDLFAYGEGKFGVLPWINQKLLEAENPKRFKNLIAVTLGTGYGGGLFTDGLLYRGDNSHGMELWITRNNFKNNTITEAGICKKSITMNYGVADLSPKEIFHIARGEHPGDQQKAIAAFETFGATLGESLADLISILDGLVVIGGGLARASSIFYPMMMKTLHGMIENINSQNMRRTVQQVYNLDNSSELSEFCQVNLKELKIPSSNKKVVYDPIKRVGIMRTFLGTNNSVNLGAYAFALDSLDKE